MFPNPSQQALDFERTELTKLENLNAELNARLHTFNTGTPYPTSEQIAALIQHLREWEQTFRGYEPGAQYLWNAGLPQLSNRLQAILAELRKIIDIWTETYQMLVDGQRRRAEIARGVEEMWTQTIRETTERRQKTFDEMHEKWRRAFLNQCPHCGYALGSYLYTYCPDCGRKILR